MSMHSNSSSSTVGKYDRELTYTLNPARANSWTVASCNDPLGIPSFSFIGLRQRPKEARALARVTDVAVAKALHLYQHGILIAVDEQRFHLETIPGGLALRP